VQFRIAANRGCSRLQQGKTSPDPSLPTPKPNRTTKPLTSAAVFSLGERFLGDVADPTSAVEQDLFAIAPPPQYRAEYELFQSEWVATARTLYRVYVANEDSVYGLYFVSSDLPRVALPVWRRHDYDLALTANLRRIRVANRLAAQAIEYATTLKLEACVGALAWVSTEAEAFSERLLGNAA
jgi:hypothetical protein